MTEIEPAEERCGVCRQPVNGSNREVMSGGTVIHKNCPEDETGPWGKEPPMTSWRWAAWHRRTMGELDDEETF